MKTNSNKTRLIMVAAKIMAGLLAQERPEHDLYHDLYHDDETLVSKSMRLAIKLEKAAEAEIYKDEEADKEAVRKFLAMVDEPEKFDEPF